MLALWSTGADGARGGEAQIGRSAWVTTGRAVAAGDRIPLWVNDDGSEVDPPTPLMQAGFDAVGVGAALEGSAILALLAGVAMVRTPLNRIRQAQLAREITRFASGGTTNRS